MSLRAIPYTLVAFLLYNFVVLFSGFGTLDPRSTAPPARAPC